MRSTPRIEAPLRFLGRFYYDLELSDPHPESTPSGLALSSPLLHIAQCWWESGCAPPVLPSFASPC
jgi:hypothetical protein